MEGWGMIIWENSLVAVVFFVVIMLIRGLTKRYSKLYVKLLWLALFAELLLPAGFRSPIWSMRAAVTEVADGLLQAEVLSGEEDGAESADWEETDFVQQTVATIHVGAQAPVWKQEAEKQAQPLTVHLVQKTEPEQSDVLASRQELITTESTLQAETGDWKKEFSEMVTAVFLPFGHSLRSMLSCLWAAGAAIVSIGYLVSFLRLKHRLLMATRWSGEVWENNRVQMPFVMPGLHSRIYIPYGLSDEQRELILAHERQHIKNGDQWLKCIAAAATVLHWFNPFVWMAFWFFGKDVELYCDEGVMKLRQLTERKEYAQVLLQFSMKTNTLLPLVSFGESDTHARVRHVLYKKRMRPFLATVLSVCLVLCCLMFLGAGRPDDGSGVILQENMEAEELETTAQTEPVTEAETQPVETIAEERSVIDVTEYIPVAEKEYLLLQCGEAVRVFDQSGQVIWTLQQAKICGEQLPEDVKRPFVDAYLADQTDVLPLAVYTGRTDYLDGYEVGMFSLESMDWIMKPEYHWLMRLSDTLCTDFTRSAESGDLMTLTGEVIREQGSFQSYGEYIWDGLNERLYDPCGTVMVEKQNETTWIAQTAEGPEEITGTDLHICSVIGGFVTWCSEGNHFVTSLNQQMYVTDQMFYERNPQLQIPGGHIQVISGREDGSELLIYLYSGGKHDYYLCDSELHILEKLSLRVQNPTHLSHLAGKKAEFLAHPWTWHLNDDHTIRVEDIWSGQAFVPEKVRRPEELTRAGEITCISSDGLSDIFYGDQEILALAQRARIVSKRNHLAVAEGGRENWYITRTGGLCTEQVSGFAEQ